MSNSEYAPTCAACDVKKKPWSLDCWKCPVCGAISVSIEAEVWALKNRVDNLDRRLLALIKKSERAA